MHKSGYQLDRLPDAFLLMRVWRGIEGTLEFGDIGPEHAA
jgi:hypothetical protein